jgi:hypothetical protein
VKTTLFAATLVMALTLSAAAATNKPPVSQHLAGSAENGPIFTGRGIPPALCDPCLFYGGDLNTSVPNAAGMSDENTLFIPGSSTYGNLTVVGGVTVTVTGILFNVQADANFDPQTASYDVRTGVSEGEGGTSIASGTANTQVAATGRNFLGLLRPVRPIQSRYWMASAMCLGSRSEPRFQVGNCARHFQDAIMGAGAEALLGHGALQQALAVGGQVRRRCECGASASGRCSKSSRAMTQSVRVASAARG